MAASSSFDTGSAPSPDLPTTIEGSAVQCSVLIRTLTGSRYLVHLTEDARWWLAGDNVPNDNSTRVPVGAWLIDAPAPWPPRQGLGIYLGAPRWLRLDDPRRIPKGGKNTSPVASWDVVAGSLPDGERDPHPGPVFNLIIGQAEDHAQREMRDRETEP